MPRPTGAARRVCYGVPEMMNQTARPNPSTLGHGCAMRRILLGLVIIPHFLAACAPFKSGPTSPEPPSSDVVAQSKGSTGNSSPEPQPESSPVTAPPAAGVKEAPPATAVPAAAGTGTQGEPNKNGAPAGKPKRPSAATITDVPAGAGSAGQTLRQSAAAKTPEKPVESMAEKPPAAATLDLASLEQRLRDTRAIGVFTKLSLKNQVDDLLGQFRAYHKKEAQISLTELRQRYNLLLMKVLTLLQDNDAPLAAAISSSREAIWLILSDPGKFAKIDVH